MERTDNKPIIWTTILGVFYLVGVVGFSLDALIHLFKTLVPYNLLLTAVILFSFHRKYNTRQITFAPHYCRYCLGHRSNWNKYKGHFWRLYLREHLGYKGAQHPTYNRSQLVDSHLLCMLYCLALYPNLAYESLYSSYAHGIYGHIY
jgi:hypothetical protein